jgi:hypothetical protein
MRYSAAANSFSAGQPAGQPFSEESLPTTINLLRLKPMKQGIGRWKHDPDRLHSKPSRRTRRQKKPGSFLARQGSCIISET